MALLTAKTDEVSSIEPSLVTTIAGPGRRRGFLVQSLAFTRTRIGLVILGLIVAVAIFGPFVAPHNAYVFVGAPFAAPSTGVPLGTDYLGHDLLSQFLNGGRIILVLALIGTILGVASGTAVGMAAGYKGGWLDEALMRLMDLMLSFPAIIFALLLISVLGPHDWLVVLVVTFSFMPNVARVIRGTTVQLIEADFVKYAEGTGMSVGKILTGELLPNIVAQLTVEFGIRFTHAIGLIAGLDYLGLGVRPPTADWGLMIQENQVGLTIRPLSVLLPVAAIALLAVGANLVTDGIGRAAAGSDRKVNG